MNKLERINYAVKILRDKKKINDLADLGSKLGYKRAQTMSDILNGDTTLTTKFVKAFCLAFGISEEWVETEAGMMFINKESQRISGSDISNQKAFGNTEDEGLIYVPIAAQAGYSRNFLDPVYIGQLERLYVPGLPYKGDNYRYFEVEGDSMEPTLEEGMQVIAQIMEFEGWKSIGEQWNNINDFYIHVIVTINQVLIKRLYKKDDETFVMISDNEDMYPQQPLKKESIKELWIVKRKLDWRMVPPKMFEKKI